MSRRWLLMLGSSLGDDRCVQAALVRLAQAGPTRALTDVVLRPSYDGDGSYFNALVEFVDARDEPRLRAALKEIEADLGRVRDGRSEVAIDIDVLAELQHQHYIASPRAAEKGEFDQPLVQELLAAAGLTPLYGSG